MTYRFKSMSQTASILTRLIGGLVLMEWALDIGTLKSVLPGFVTMKANTALAFLLAAVVPLGVTVDLIDGQDAQRLMSKARGSCGTMAIPHA